MVPNSPLPYIAAALILALVISEFFMTIELDKYRYRIEKLEQTVNSLLNDKLV